MKRTAYIPINHIGTYMVLTTTVDVPKTGHGNIAKVLQSTASSGPSVPGVVLQVIFDILSQYIWFITSLS